MSLASFLGSNYDPAYTVDWSDFNPSGFTITGIQKMIGIPWNVPYNPAGSHPGFLYGSALITSTDPTTVSSASAYIQCPLSSHYVDLWFNSQIWALSVTAGGVTYTGTQDWSVPDPTGQNIFLPDAPSKSNLANTLRSNNFVEENPVRTLGFKFTVFANINYYYLGGFYFPFTFQGVGGVPGSIYAYTCQNFAGAVNAGMLTFLGSLSNIPAQIIYADPADIGAACSATITGTQWA